MWSRLGAIGSGFAVADDGFDWYSGTEVQHGGETTRSAFDLLGLCLFDSFSFPRRLGLFCCGRFRISLLRLSKSALRLGIRLFFSVFRGLRSFWGLLNNASVRG